MNKYVQHVEDKISDWNSNDILFSCNFKLRRHEVKKNRRKIMRNFRTGKSFIGKSEDLHAAEANYISEFIKAKYKYKLEAITCDVWMIAIFEFKESDLMTKKGVRKKTSPNLSNLYQIVEDCMQTPKISASGRRTHNGAGIIIDDDQIRAHDLSRIVSGDETRLHVYLIRYDETKLQ